MKPIKRISDPDGTQYEADSLEKERQRQAKDAIGQMVYWDRLAKHFNVCGIENDDDGLIKYAKDINNIIKKMKEIEDKDLDNIRRMR